MKLNVDWRGMMKAIVKAIIHFLSGALGGFLSGCSMFGSGVGVTL